MKVFKITRPTEELNLSMENDEPGDKVCFEMVEMSEEELHALDDFGGW